MFTNAANRYGYRSNDESNGKFESGIIVWNDIHEEVYNQRRWAKVLSPHLSSNLEVKPFLPLLRGDIGGPGPSTSDVLESHRQRQVEILSEVPDAD
mmetsp:Transcript_32623/g.45488  ORF Transcript_32623/g.45488 Transcript_32623/m.45488 type:complete len:96 (-) Transcript_32623:120-407(-)